MSRKCNTNRDSLIKSKSVLTSQLCFQNFQEIYCKPENYLTKVI